MKDEDKSRYVSGISTKATATEKIVDQIEIGLHAEMSDKLFHELSSLSKESLREIRDLFIARVVENTKHKRGR